MVLNAIRSVERTRILRCYTVIENASRHDLSNNVFSSLIRFLAVATCVRARAVGRESTVTHRRVTRGARVDLVRMAARARRSLVAWDTVVSVRSRTLETTVKRSGVVSCLALSNEVPCLRLVD